VMQHRAKQSPGLRSWLAQLLARTHQNVAIVALANKLVRMAWAVLCKNEVYRSPILATSRPGVADSTQGRIHWRRPNCHSRFRLHFCGGPYIPLM